jgi:RNA polymerase sigma-70 factor (sigma-E family)
VCEYRVQYRETDFAFVSRLMEESGIYYFFAHTDGKHTLVLADAYGAHAPMHGCTQVPYFPRDLRDARRGEHIDTWAIAEDLVQTALTRAWLAWGRIGDDPDPYVYRILVNTHHSWWRRRWHGEVPTASLPDVPASAAGDTEPHGAFEDRDALWKALGRLGKRERAAIVLRYFSDLEHAAIAEILGCSPGTVRGQISRALAKLRVDSTLRDLDFQTFIQQGA